MFLSLLWTQFVSHTCMLFLVSLCIWVGLVQQHLLIFVIFFCVRLKVLVYFNLVCISWTSETLLHHGWINTNSAKTPGIHISMQRTSTFLSQVHVLTVNGINVFALHPTARVLLQHSTVTYNLSIHQNLNWTVSRCFLYNWINGLIQMPLESVSRLC